MTLLSEEMLAYINWAIKNITAIQDAAIVTIHIYEKGGIPACLEYHKRLSSHRQDEVKKTMLHYWYQDNFVGIEDIRHTLPKDVLNDVLSYDVKNTYPDAWYHPLKERDHIQLLRYAQRSLEHQKECIPYIPPFHPLFPMIDIIDWNQVLAHNIKKREIEPLIQSIKNKQEFWLTVSPEDIRACVKHRSRNTMPLPLEELLITILDNRLDLQDVYYQEILEKTDARWHSWPSIFHNHPLVEDILQKSSETETQRFVSPTIKDMLRVFTLVGPKIERLKKYYVTQETVEYGTLLELMYKVYTTEGVDRVYWEKFFNNIDFVYPNLYVLSFLYDLQRYEMYNLFAEEVLLEAFQYRIKICDYPLFIKTLEQKMKTLGIEKHHYSDALLTMEELAQKNCLKEYDIVRMMDMINNSSRIDFYLENMILEVNGGRPFIECYEKPMGPVEECSLIM